MLLICSTKNRHGNQPLHRLCRSSMEPGFSRASRLLPVAASAAAASLDCPFSADGSGGGRSPARLGRAGGVCEEAARTFPIFGLDVGQCVCWRIPWISICYHFSQRNAQSEVAQPCFFFSLAPRCFVALRVLFSSSTILSPFSICISVLSAVYL